MTEFQSPSRPKETKAAFRNTCACGMALVGVFLLIYLLSPPFEYGSELHRRTLEVTGLLLLAGVIAFVGLTNALKVPKHQCRAMLLMIVCFALSTRLIAVFTCPILEIDYYRYLWDGKVSAAGMSPFLHSPDQVLNANPTEDGMLGQLQTLSLESESNHTILSRIHYETHTTIYPSTSQYVFASVMKWLPHSASVEAHIVAMKLALVLFDLGTLILVYFLLKQLDLSIGWLLVYAWNPLGVGAKLFPVVMFPALAVFLWRQNWKRASLFSLTFAAVSALTLTPMFAPIVLADASENSSPTTISVSAEQPSPEVVDAKFGAVGFFSQWRMNDTVFSVAYLNLKNSDREIQTTPWYVFTEAEFRKRFENWFRTNTSIGNNAAFFIARVLTLSLFLGFYCWQLAGIYHGRIDSENICGSECRLLLQRMALVLIVFLFLQPTVNPWYFVWAMPLLCFSSNRGWLIVSGLMLTYYSRFWFQMLAGQWTIAGRSYEGVGIYDHVVVWLVAILALGILVFFRYSKFGKCENDGRRHVEGAVKIV